MTSPPRTMLGIARAALIEAGVRVARMTDAEILERWRTTVFAKHVGRQPKRQGPWTKCDHPWRAESRKQLRERRRVESEARKNNPGAKP